MDSLNSFSETFNEHFRIILQKDFWNFVRFNGNEELSVHRWFYFKEGFSANLLHCILGYLKLDKKEKINLLDPFLGSGTTLLSAQTYNKMELTGIGIEVHPFLHFVAKTKLIWNEIDLNILKRNLAKIKQNIRTSGDNGSRVTLDEIPNLSTFQNRKYFPKKKLMKLILIKNEINTLPDSKEKDILKLAFASIIEDSSFLKKDGRALRYLPDKALKSPFQNFLDKMNIIIQDITQIRQRKLQINNVSSLNLDAGKYLDTTNKRFDVAFFSPPYPNKLNYVEVYKLETWFLDFVTNYKEYRNLSRNTFISHDSHDLSINPSKIKIPNPFKNYLFRIFPETKSKERNMMIKYLENFYEILEKLSSCIKENGYCIIVIGNPLFKINNNSLVVIPVDSILNSFTNEIGFDLVSKIFNYKRPRGVRLSNYQRKKYRESIIFFKRR